MDYNHITFSFKNPTPKDFRFIEEIMGQLNICKANNYLLDMQDEFRGDTERLIVLEDRLQHQVVASYFQHDDDVSLTLNIPFDFLIRWANHEGEHYEMVLDTSAYPGVFGLGNRPLHVLVPGNTQVTAS